MKMNSQREPVEDRLQICLEEVLSGRQSLEEAVAQNPELEEALRSGLEAAMWLSSRRKLLEPRPGFVAASRRRLVARRFRLRGSSEHAPARSFFERVLRLLTNRFVFQASLVVLVVMALLVGNVLSAAARTTLPGDFLYPVKTFSEGVQLTFSMSPSRKAGLQIEFARRRVTEVEALVLEGRMERAAATLAIFDRQAGQAAAALESLRMQDPEAAQRLALSLDRLLDNQSQVFLLLSASAPEGQNPALSAAVRTSQANMAEIHETLLNLGVLVLGTPTLIIPQASETPPSPPGGSSTLPPGQAGGEAAASTSTPRPTLTPRPTNTHRPTQQVKETKTPRASSTPKPTFTPRIEITRKPTNTPRPTNTHRPPKTTDPPPKPTKTKKS
jgi:hypothetical protein